MTAATLAPAPVRDMLAWITDDAVKYREPQADDCGTCTLAGGPCLDHAGDQAIADAMHALLSAVESAATDEEAVEALRACAPLVLAVIARATEDEDGGDRDDV